MLFSPPLSLVETHLEFLLHGRVFSAIMSVWKFLTLLLVLQCRSHWSLLQLLWILQTQPCVLAHLSNPVPGRHRLSPEILFWRGWKRRKLAEADIWLHSLCNLTSIVEKKKNVAWNVGCLSDEMVSTFVKGGLQEDRTLCIRQEKELLSEILYTEGHKIELWNFWSVFLGH